MQSGDHSVLAQTEASLGADATRAGGLKGPVREALATLRKAVPPEDIEAVGYRVVHGGRRFTSAVRVSPRVLTGIEALGEFAPLHNHLAVETIRAGQALLPKLPHVASFDTAFHAGLPEEAFVYPLPYAWYRDWKVRRFGFHGLSVEWSLGRASELLKRPADQLALIVAHLGSGCSVTAVLEGRSVDTSMGLTPLEGLMMGTRAGSVDPGILLYVQRAQRIGTRQLDQALNHESGLVGVSGKEAGMRELEQAAARGEKRARLAIDIFTRRAAAGIAAAASALPRVDALVFTGGIGEHSATVRDAIVGRLVTVKFDRVLTVEAREDAVIARQVAALL